MPERIYRWIAVLATGLLLIAVMIANMMYTRHVNDESDRKWCSILVAISAPDTPPSETARGQQIRKDIARLAHEYGCYDDRPD